MPDTGPFAQHNAAAARDCPAQSVSRDKTANQSRRPPRRSDLAMPLTRRSGLLRCTRPIPAPWRDIPDFSAMARC